jgi:hypothetical protein
MEEDKTKKSDVGRSTIKLDESMLEEVIPPPMPEKARSKRVGSTTQRFEQQLQQKVAQGTDKQPIEVIKSLKESTAAQEREGLAEPASVKDGPYSPGMIVSRWKMYKSEQAYDSATGIDRLNFEGVIEIKLTIEGREKYVRFGIEMSYLAQGLRIIENAGRIVCDLFQKGEKPFKMHEVMKYGREIDRASAVKSAVFIVVILNYIDNEIVRKLEAGEKL